MLLRDLQAHLRRRFGLEAAARAGTAASAGGAAGRGALLAAQERRQDFGPIVTPAGGRVAVWAWRGDQRIMGWTEGGELVVDAPFTPPGGASWIFAEGADGYLYGVTSLRDVIRVQAGGRAASYEILTTLPPGREGVAVLVDPAGRIFIKDRATSGVHAPRGSHYWRLVGSSLVAAGEVDAPFAEYAAIRVKPLGQPPNPDLEWYYAELRTQTLYRLWYEAILPGGRWVAADPLRPFPTVPADWEGGFREWRSASDYDQHDIVLSYDDTTNYITVTAELCGNAWWERADHQASWTAVANGGTSVGTAQVAAGRYQPAYHIVEGIQGASPPSVHGTVRDARCAASCLPVLRVVWRVWSHWVPGPFGGSIQPVYHSNFAVQQVLGVEADASHLYLLMHGAYDMDGSETWHPHGLYRAPIPAPGAAPTWTQVVAEPDDGWQDLAVSRSALWITEHLPVQGQAVRRYTKSGAALGTVAEHAQGVSNLTTGWAARWR
ncbi:MAG: hypothetical protein QN174_13360 [Armatimonadota bacterium]|nr:hypothetical protein [Armatimonadota bacterium]